MTLAVGVHGASGRLGGRIVARIGDVAGLSLGAAIVRPGHPSAGLPSPVAGVAYSTTLDRPVDVVIDVSTPSASLALARACVDRRVPLVVGTTGFGPEERRAIEAASASIPLLIAANFSRGVALLLRLVAEASRALGEGADVEVVERHHRFKKDAPSGTALRIAEAVESARGSGRAGRAHGRIGLVGERPRGEIGLHALRIGDNPGEHEVAFGWPGESISIAHRALSRDAFALGALDAARFLAGRPPGLYRMDDLFDAPPGGGA